MDNSRFIEERIQFISFQLHLNLGRNSNPSNLLKTTCPTGIILSIRHP
jgi:hypothetical protein